MRRTAILMLTGLLWSFLGLAFGQSLTRGPYLQNVTPTSVIIVWVTDPSGNSEVEFGETSSYGSWVSDPAIGNHEYDYTNYLDYFYLPTGSGSERYYSFDYGNAHFVALDTNISYSAGSAQHTWFVNDLQSTTKPWRFVYFHHPPYSSSLHGSNTTVRAQLCPVIEANGVQMVFSGHDHDYERSYVNGVTYIVTGGGGAPLYSAGTSSWTQFSASEYHACKVSITGNNLTLEAIKPDGTVIDSFATSTGVPDWYLY